MPSSSTLRPSRGEEAERKYQEAKSNLEGYLERHFREHEGLARKLETAAVSSRPSGVPSRPVAEAGPADSSRAPESSAGDASQRAALQRELADLKRSLAQMLTVRTSMHPEVQDLDARIRDLSRRLDSLAQQSRGRADNTVAMSPSRQPAISAAPTVPGGNNGLEAGQAAEHAEAARTYWGLIAEFQRAVERQRASAMA